MNNSSELLYFKLETPQENMGRLLLAIFACLFIATVSEIAFYGYANYLGKTILFCIPFIAAGIILKFNTKSHYVYDTKRRILFFNYVFFNLTRTTVISVRDHMRAIVVDATKGKENEHSESIFWQYQMGILLQNKHFFYLSDNSRSLEKINQLATKASETMQIEAFLNPGEKFPSLGCSEKNELTITFEDKSDYSLFEKDPLFFTILVYLALVLIPLFFIGLFSYLAWHTYLLIFG